MASRRVWMLGGATALLALLVGVPSALSSGPKTKRVTLKSNGNEVNADADAPAISGNGRFVSFESVGKFTQDNGPYADVFVHDRKSGRTSRVSVKPNGKGSNGDCEDSSMSASGRFVAFACDDGLVPSDQNGTLDVYVKDRRTAKVTRASVMSNGQGVGADAVDPSISADGRYVAFDSDGAYVGGDINGKQDVYVHDLKTGKTKLASIRSDGDKATQDSEHPSISGDGRYVAFESSDNNMTADPDYPFNDPMVDTDVFVRDMKAGKTTRVSIKQNGVEVQSASAQSNIFPAISGDGRFVAFTADAFGNFAVNDTNNASDVYVHNMNTGKNKRISVKSNGDEGTLGSGAETPNTISASGRFVGFDSMAKLSGADHNNGPVTYRDVYVRDRKTGTTRLISVKSNGNSVKANNQLPAISGNGAWVAFSSMGKFTGNDAGSDFDVFERGPLP